MNNIEYFDNYYVTFTSPQYGPVRLRLTSDSGRVIVASKLGTVEHEGIIVGVDDANAAWVIHNHPKSRGMAMVSLAEFSSGTRWWYSEGKCSFDREVVLQRAIQVYQSGLQYDFLRSNCQHASALACTNVFTSRQVNNMLTGAVVLGLAFWGVKVLNEASV